MIEPRKRSDKPGTGSIRRTVSDVLNYLAPRLVRREHTNTMTSNPRLIIPVYLNQRMVFDLVAMIQGGISTVTRVQETHADTSAADSDVRGAFGLANAFASLLRIDLSTSRKTKTSAEAARATDEQRVHTPASLFFTLRELLLERELLQPERTDAPEVGAFMEFSATLRRNPVVEVMDALHEIMRMAAVFAEPTPQSERSRQTRKQRRGADENASDKSAEQIQNFRNMLRAGETADLMASDLPGGHRAVITVETGYLNDPSMGDLVDGTFMVLGKVTRVLPSATESISLVRKTALETLPRPVLEQAFGSLNALGSQQGFALPTVEWEISGPVVQILPIAIYS